MIEEIIDQELAKRNWKLSTRPELFDAGETFSTRVQKRTREWIEQGRPSTPEIIRAATKHEYSILLQSALKGSGPAQASAITEISAYLRPVVLRFLSDKDLAEEALSRAVTQIWLHNDMCYQGSLLAWAGQIALNEAKAAIKKNAKQDPRTWVASLDDMDRSSLDTDDEDAIDQRPSLENGFAYIDVLDSRRNLISRIENQLSNERRAKIIIGHFFLDMTASDIAAWLSLSVQLVYTEKHRALAILRRDPDLIAELKLLTQS